MVKIQKYKAKVLDSDLHLIGYITEVREYKGSGVYGQGTSYLISVTSKSMPGGNYGTYLVDPDSIEKLTREHHP